MMKRLSLAAALLLSAAPVSAAEVNVPAAAGGADITVYNNDLAMVRERRTFRLPAASAQLAFTGVSNRMQPETAFLDITKGDAVKVAEQSFHYGVITPQALLEKAVGQDVSILYTNPATGKETVQRGKVLGVAGGPVIDIGGKIHTDVLGRIVFDTLPPGLRAMPTLLMTVTGAANKDAESELSYLTDGLSWHADYVAHVDPDAGRMDLMAWATINNSTGVDFKDARLKLVAGDVNRAAPPRPMRMEAKTMAATAAAPAMADGVTEQTVDAAHVYSMAKPSSLMNQESKQLALFSGQGIAARREIVVRNEQQYIYSNAVRGQIPETRANTEMVFKNDAAAKLGVPLPAGTVRVYGADEQGNALFMGEAPVDHTAVGGEVRLKLGRDFDVPVTREQMTFARASDTITVSSWKVTVRNAKAKPIKIRLLEPMPESWEISRESQPHKASNAGFVEWNMDVPAKGQAVLEYTVKSTF
jgi:hypothetical protein